MHAIGKALKDDLEKDHFNADRDSAPDIGAHEYGGVIIERPDPPVADFTIDAGQGKAPHTVNFTDQSKGNIVRREWILNNKVTTGGTSTDRNPTYTYVLRGVYDVSLTVTDDKNRSVTAHKPGLITVKGGRILLNAEFTTGDGQGRGRAPHTVNFQDTSIGKITKWHWSFDDVGVAMATADTQNPEYTFRVPGVYAVSLTVENASGRSNTESKSAFITIEKSDSEFRRFVLYEVASDHTVAYGIQFPDPDLRCVLLLADDPAYIAHYDNIEDVSAVHFQPGVISLRWVDETA